MLRRFFLDFLNKQNNTMSLFTEAIIIKDYTIIKK